MFTRLDAVQNIKRLNAALSRGNLNDAELEVGLYNLILISFFFSKAKCLINNFVVFFVY